MSPSSILSTLSFANIPSSTNTHKTSIPNHTPQTKSSNIPHHASPNHITKPKNQRTWLSEIKFRMSEQTFKICLVGNTAVGKTSLVQRIQMDSFSPENAATVGVNCSKLTVTREDKPYVINIWDTAGQERYDGLRGQYYRDGDGVIIGYSVDNRTSFDRVKSYWISEVNKHLPNCVKFLVAMKTDLRDSLQDCVTCEEGEKAAKELGIDMFTETSAMLGQGINDFPNVLLQCLLEKKVNAGKPKEGVDLKSGKHKHGKCNC